METRHHCYLEMLKLIVVLLGYLTPYPRNVETLWPERVPFRLIQHLQKTDHFTASCLNSPFIKPLILCILAVKHIVSFDVSGKLGRSPGLCQRNKSLSFSNRPC